SRSAGRFPDGADTDRNCADFHLQAASSTSADSDAGVTNIKVTSVADFVAGQKIFIDSGTNREAAVIATVGTSGSAQATTGPALDAHWNKILNLSQNITRTIVAGDKSLVTLHAIRMEKQGSHLSAFQRATVTDNNRPCIKASSA